MATILNDMINDKNNVYYEYRETFYRVDGCGREYECNRRETYDDCVAPMSRALKLAAKYVEMPCSTLDGWDLVTISVKRCDSYGSKAVFESNLFADDFAE